MYEVQIIKKREEITKGNIADISVYNWGGAYQPVSKAILCFLKNEGFLLKIWSEEFRPRATFTGKNEGVCRDSCLEFFANFALQKEHSGYINFEANANGALLCCYGENRYDRRTIEEMGLVHPTAVPFKEANCWGYELLIPLSLLQGVYDDVSFEEGTLIRGNFYKCGDDTEIPHYGSFTKIIWEDPDFHRPEFFEDMILVD